MTMQIALTAEQRRQLIAELYGATSTRNHILYEQVVDGELFLTVDSIELLREVAETLADDGRESWKRLYRACAAQLVFVGG